MAVAKDVVASPAAVAPNTGEFWTANAVFFVAMHAIGLASFWVYPPSRLPWQTLFMLPLLWQAAVFGYVHCYSFRGEPRFDVCRITVGYHRMWSHRAFRAGPVVRAILAFWGAMGFQGSVKVSWYGSLFDLC